MEIDERKRVEESLRKAEQDWRNSFNSLEEVMLIIDKDYKIENINSSGLVLLGKNKGEVIGKKWRLKKVNETMLQYYKLWKRIEINDESFAFDVIDAIEDNQARVSFDVWKT